MERRQSFKITFYLRRTRLTKAGLAPVLSRVTVNGIAAEIPLKCHIYPEKWSQQKERAIGKDKLSSEINATLDSFKAKVLEIRTQIQHEGGDVNIHEVKRRLTQGNTTRMFLKELEDYCKLRQKEVGVNITQLTADKFGMLRGTGSPRWWTRYQPTGIGMDRRYVQRESRSAP